MEFDTTVTASAFVVLFAILAGGTLTSGMPARVTMMVLPGLFVSLLLALVLGVERGEYRARTAR